jgi:pyruvate/2-oxoglutarate dehydrogenase complex dihydrolipoamide acyltransferase (E2) component
MDVVMPQMGESVAEGTIVRWLKKVGDTIERDEPLFEISTDKVDAEVPSPAAGVVTEIRHQEGETVEINTVVAVIGKADSVSAAAPHPHSHPRRRKPRLCQQRQRCRLRRRNLSTFLFPRQYLRQRHRPQRVLTSGSARRRWSAGLRRSTTSTCRRYRAAAPAVA